ncbi:hypothetical protein ACIXO6_18895 [Bacteroides fragilis]
MDKLPICLIMLLAVLLNSCGRKSSTTVPDKGSDSIYRYDHITTSPSVSRNGHWRWPIQRKCSTSCDRTTPVSTP